MAETNSTAQLVSKLNEASKKIKAVRKDGQNSFQRYSFQSEAAIKSTVKAAIESVGIVITPSYEITGQRDIKNNKGHIAHIVDVLGIFTITDGDSELIGKMPGSGMDTGEKATAKACTSAQKYFYKQLFNISDRDEDPDATDSNLAQRSSNYRSRSTGKGTLQTNNYQRQPQQPMPQRQQTNTKASNEFERLVNKIAVNSGSPVANVREAIGKTLNANKEYQSMSPVDKQKKAISVAKNMLGGNQNGK